MAETDNFALTEYGKEVLSECFTNTLEYYVPADHSQNSLSDHSNGDTDHEMSSPPNWDIM